MDLDVSPIIPEEPKIIREPYNLALTKLLRANDHKIISSSVRYQGSTIHIQIDIQSDTDIVDKLQSMKDLDIKEDIYDNISKQARKEAEEFINRIRDREPVLRPQYIRE